MDYIVCDEVCALYVAYYDDYYLSYRRYIRIPRSSLHSGMLKSILAKYHEIPHILNAIFARIPCSPALTSITLYKYGIGATQS